ncbi:MAG: disulfide bond formation protein B [Rhodanobacter sp.]
MSPSVSRALNSIGLLAVCLVLLIAFVDQLTLHDLPCPLCLLQRAGFVGAGFGLALNMRFGPRPSHYALTLFSAIAGATVSARQTLLHIVPGTGTYGQAILGMHFYAWAFVVFVLIIIGTATMLLFDRQFTNHHSGTPMFSRIAASVVVLFGLLVLGNAVSTGLECGGGLCPDNPITYQLLGN